MMFIYEKDLPGLKEIARKWESALMWGTGQPYIPKPEDFVKLAFVIKDGKSIIAGVDNRTLEGFELHEDMKNWEYRPWKLPLVPMQYDKFERWCTLFDV